MNKLVGHIGLHFSDLSHFLRSEALEDIPHPGGSISATQPWFTTLFKLLVVLHERLPSRLDFLTQTVENEGTPMTLNLAIWLQKTWSFGI